jgi:hypothetical protein
MNRMTKLQKTGGRALGSRIVVVFLLLAGGAQVFAQQTDVKPVALDKYAAPDKRQPPAAAPAREFSAGRRVGAAFMNPLLGLGSYTMGDWLGGGLISGGYLVAGGLLLWEIFRFEWDDELVGLPGGIGLGVAGATTVFGILRPLFYHRSGSNRKAAAALSGVNIAAIPAVSTQSSPHASGIKAVHLGYRFQR